MDNMVLPPCLFGNIIYYRLLMQETCVIDIHEHFSKQTYRTRYDIYGANGLIALSVPIQRPHGVKLPIKDISISYEEAWQNNHWRTLISAYKRSPFFEFYELELKALYQTRYNYLLDFFEAAHQFLTQSLNLKPALHYTSGYVAPDTVGTDLRKLFKPSKITWQKELFEPYWQVFQEKSGFLPNLSVLDLIFNEGPNAVNVLMATSVTPLIKANLNPLKP